MSVCCLNGKANPEFRKKRLSASIPVSRVPTTYTRVRAFVITFLPRGHGNVGTCATLNPRSDPYVIHGRSSRHNGDVKHADKPNKKKEIAGKEISEGTSSQARASKIVSKIRLGFSIMRNTL